MMMYGRTMPLISCILAIACLIMVLSGTPAARAEEQDSTLSRRAVEQMVREFLIREPEVLEEAFGALQVKREEAAEAWVQDSLRREAANFFDDPSDPVIGNPEGAVRMVYFLDYQCGFCKSMHETLAARLTSDGLVRASFKELPVLGEMSVAGARAALAAGRQGAYRAMHDALMTHQGRLSEEDILGIVLEIGLDMVQFEADWESEELVQKIERNHELAALIRVQGTPALVIGERVYRGAVPGEVLDEAIQSAVDARLVQ